MGETTDCCMGLAGGWDLGELGMEPPMGLWGGYWLAAGADIELTCWGETAGKLLLPVSCC